MISAEVIRCSSDYLGIRASLERGWKRFFKRHGNEAVTTLSPLAAIFSGMPAARAIPISLIPNR